VLFTPPRQEEEKGDLGGERTIYLRREVLRTHFTAEMRLSRLLLELDCHGVFVVAEEALECRGEFLLL